MVGWHKSQWSGSSLFLQMINTQGYSFIISIAYWERDASKQKYLWKAIQDIRMLDTHQDWLINGDFNENPSLEGCEGHGIYDVNGATDFNEFVHDLAKLDSVGFFFIWNIGTRPNHTRTKLDRILGSENWVTQWPNV